MSDGTSLATWAASWSTLFTRIRHQNTHVKQNFRSTARKEAEKWTRRASPLRPELSTHRARVALGAGIESNLCTTPTHSVVEGDAEREYVLMISATTVVMGFLIANVPGLSIARGRPHAKAGVTSDAAKMTTAMILAKNMLSLVLHRQQ